MCIYNYIYIICVCTLPFSRIAMKCRSMRVAVEWGGVIRMRHHRTCQSSPKYITRWMVIGSFGLIVDSLEEGWEVTQNRHVSPLSVQMLNAYLAQTPHTLLGFCSFQEGTSCNFLQDRFAYVQDLSHSAWAASNFVPDESALVASSAGNSPSHWHVHPWNIQTSIKYPSHID